MNAISMNHLWDYLQGLALTTDNRKWLAEKLVSETKADKKLDTTSKIHVGKVTLPTDKFVGMYDFSREDEDRMRREYLKEKYNLDWEIK